MSFLLLMIVFRSVLVPLKAALMNLLSIAAAYGVLVAVFQWGWGNELIGLHSTMPINPFLPLIMFAILFGLSMDYEVFLLSRVREEYVATGDNHEAVVRGLSSTARVITSAALIMISVFGAFVLGDDPNGKLFGVGLAVAVLIDATLVRMVLVPATMSLLGRANWWLPGWLDRILPHLDLEGAPQGRRGRRRRARARAHRRLIQTQRPRSNAAATNPQKGCPMQSMTPTHPVEFDVDYPDAQLNRVSTFFRLLFAVPILVVLAALGGPAFGGGGGDWLFFIGLASGLLVIPPLLMIVFREKYPRWWFDFNLAFLRFDNRVMSYLLLLRDEFPSTDEEQAVHLDVPYPDVRSDLNRWMPLVKWFLAIPHYLGLARPRHRSRARRRRRLVRDPRSPAATPAGSSTSSSASCVGTTGSSATPSPRRTDQYPPFRLAA